MLGGSREVSVVSAKEDSMGSILETQYSNTNLAFQAFIQDENGVDKYSFHNSIKTQGRNVYMLGNEQFHIGKLLNWQECLDTLMKKGEWLEAFSLGLDLFHGKDIKLLDVPTDKNAIKSIIIKVVQEYVYMQTIGWEYKITNAIEYCIGIKATDFLFEELF